MDYLSSHRSVGRRTRAKEAAFLKEEWERRNQGRSAAASRRSRSTAAAEEEEEEEEEAEGAERGRVSRGSKRGGGEREEEDEDAEVPLARKRRRRGVSFSDLPEESGGGAADDQGGDGVDNVSVLDDQMGEEMERGSKGGIGVDSVSSVSGGREENVENADSEGEGDVITISSSESESESELESSGSSGNDDTDLDGNYNVSEGSTSEVGGVSGEDHEFDCDFSSGDSEQECSPRMRYEAERRVPRPNVFTDDITGVKLKRKMVSGLNVLVPDSGFVIGTSSVAQRTRSHSVSTFSVKMKKRMGLGTFSSPIRCDEEDFSSSNEADTSSSSSYDSYSDDGGRELGGTEEGRINTVGEGGTEVVAGMVKKGSKRKRKEKIIGAAENEKASKIKKGKTEAAKKTKTTVTKEKKSITLGKAGKERLMKERIEVGENENIEKRVKKESRKKDKEKYGRRTKYPPALYNLLCKEVNGVVQQEAKSRCDVPHSPVDFIFEVEEPIGEKTDYEKQLEPLWSDFDFALRSIELGSFNSSAIDNENARKSNIEGDPSTLCQGEHDLILDEEVGWKCTLCSFVKVEIRDVHPSMDTSGGERIGRKYSSDAANIFWEGIHFQDGVSQGLSPELKGTIWERFPNIREKMYKHQQEGFEFMWRNLAGSINLEELKNPNTSEGVGGCVISHAPGTGKTFLTIAFVQTFMSVFEDCRPVIVAPYSMLLTWEEEFRKWNVDIPFHNLNATELSRNEDEDIVQFAGGWNNCSKESARLVKLMSWRKGKSVLGISYSLFEKHAGEKIVKDKDGRRKEVPRDKIGEDIKKTLLEMPSLLVLDEGHTPRNERSRIWKALQNIKTERRIILSGTPFQNNFDELYNTLWLVRPKFANRISSTKKICQAPSNSLSEKEAKGKWASLTNLIGKGSEPMLQEIRSMIEPFVHVHKGAILQNLPGLRDCVIRLNLTELQKELLEEAKEIKNQLKLEHVVSLVTIHPSLFLSCEPPKIQKPFYDKIALKTFKLDPSNGVKTRFLMELIKLSDALNEKVLVFSQYINPFVLIKDQLRHYFNWSEGVEIEQMDGKLNMTHRQSLIKSFNDPSSKVRVLLASIKACREGISLIGASRVVLLDVVWNPSVVRQAISRAYRIGQKKIVHTYHLITSGTEEQQKYWRQVQKNRLSKLVFSSSLGHASERSSSSVISDDKILAEMVANENLKDMFDKIKIITKTVDCD